MRVLFIIHELALNGAATSLLAQTRALIDGGEQVSVLIPPLAGPAAALRETFLAAGARLVSKTEVHEHDVAVGCTVFAADTLAQLAGDLPLVWWIHEGVTGAQYVMTHQGTSQLLNHVNRLVFPGRGTVDLWSALLSHLPPGRVEVIPALVSSPVPGPAAEKAAGRVRVLCVGSIDRRKRQGDLLAAIAALGPTATVDCVLVGERMTPEPATESLLAAHGDRFVLAGGVAPAALPAYYRSADIFVLPSGDESMPIAPIEAASHGVPVILSDLPCYAGIWRHGVNALLYPVGDVELLAWSLHILINSPGLRMRLAAAGRTLAARFGPARTTAPFTAMLAEVMLSEV